QAMKSVDRGKYVKYDPYRDSPQQIGYGATISAPHMHAHALENLTPFLRPGMKVIGIDHIPQLVNLAKDNVMNDRPELLESQRVIFVLGDGRKGYPEEAPYDCIHVGAAAEKLPQDLIDQLKSPGR
ncbi:8833_t:CDS:2, partial [Racocetra fulgida]